MLYRISNIIKIITAFCIVALIISVLFLVDYIRVENKKDPIFAYAKEIIEPGFVKEFYGLFYKINKYVKLETNSVEYEIGFLTMPIDNAKLNIYNEL